MTTVEQISTPDLAPSDQIPRSVKNLVGRRGAGRRHSHERRCFSGPVLYGQCSEDRAGARREGVYTSFYSFVEKFTFAFGPLIVGVAMSVAGFNEELPPEALQTPQIRQALLLGMSYIPVSMGLLSIVLLSGYKLKEEDLIS